VKNTASRLVLLLSCCLTILAGCALIPYAGIQMDEALFTGPYYQPVQREFRLRLFHHDIPLMVMTYIGTLKTLLFWPLITIFRSSFAAHPSLAAWVFRLPTVLAGALTVYIFFYLTERAVSRSAAMAAALLLASDPTFLLTNTFDWGPVALEHLLLVTGCFFLVKFAQERFPRDLVFGFFFLGVALWNKAIFVWALAGLICGTLFVFGRDLSKMITRRHLGLAAAGFLAGSLPFIIYNGHRRMETFRANTHLDPRGAPAKFIHVRSALRGDGLYAYLASEEYTDLPKNPASPLGRAAVFLRDRTGQHRGGGMEYAVLLAFLAVPLWWRFRAARFCLVFCVVAWFLMASTRDAGASIHHTVLLWPFPQLFVAIAIAAIPWRWAGGVLCGLLVFLNVLVISQYISQFARHGAEGNWTDAIYPLSASIPEIPGQTIYELDWGIEYPLRVYHDGHLKIGGGHDPFMSDTIDKPAALKMFADPNALFIAHAEKRENFTGVYKRFNETLESAGCRKENFRSIPDSNGRPVFEIFQLTCPNP
jgi:hypothetical protein